MIRRLSRRGLLTLAGAALLTAAGCERGPSSGAAAGAALPEPPEVRVAAVEARTIDRTIRITGSLLPDETVALTAEVPGRLTAIRVDFGQRVRKGDIVAELDARELRLQLDRSRASLAQVLSRVGLRPGQEDVSPESTPAIRQVEAQLEDARFKYDNAARLVRSGDVSRERFNELEKTHRGRQAALEAARDELRTQLAAIQALRADVRLAEKRLDDATVRAPFDGAVTARSASPGQYLRENTPILTLVKADPLRLRAEVPESAAGAVRVGTSLQFTTGAAPGARFRAVVRELGPALDSRTRSLAAEARLVESDTRLRPGMFVQIEIVTARGAVVPTVPREAIYSVAGLTKVFVIREGRVVEHRIPPGAEVDGRVEVPVEIRPGERVAVANLGMLVHGAAVRAGE